MSPKHTNSGIHPGDQVILYLNSYSNGRQEAVNIRFAEVERVTPTQVIIEGIRYHADPYSDRRGEPVKPEDREYVEEGEHDGRRQFAHPNIVDPVVWEHLIARKDRPEALALAKELNARVYHDLGYESHMNLAQLIELSKDPDLITSLSGSLDQLERARQDALDSTTAFFARYAPAKVDR